MDKKQLNELMPRDKNDEDRAKYIASFDYDTVHPVVQEMLRWLRTYRVDDTSPVADVFIKFFVSNANAAAEDVKKVLTTSRQNHLKYVIVTRVLPEWPRQAIEQVAFPLTTLVTHSDEPETALMSLQILAKHNLAEKAWLKG